MIEGIRFEVKRKSKKKNTCDRDEDHTERRSQVVLCVFVRRGDLCISRSPGRRGPSTTGGLVSMGRSTRSNRNARGHIQRGDEGGIIPSRPASVCGQSVSIMTKE